ncbi:MAG TPA: NAD(P)/FAD-dependent oxidoreductase [Capillimicrobium sp.]|nr:NAD(P)/FAD-dependent oxidoreductase [Capillimicrobium sp.]
MDETWDCVVVGGGAAGLSAALALGRARRRTLVVDAGRPSNLPAEGIGGLLGHDHRPPADLYAAGRAELRTYPSVAVRAGEVTGGEATGDGFVLALDGDAERVRARRVLLATGMDYRHPDVPGLAERWGRTVFHCPFCHGWEVREQPLCALGEAHAAERALMLRAWSDDVTLLADGAPLAPEDERRLHDAGVTIDPRPVAEVRDGAVAFADGTERPCGGILVATTLHQRSALARTLGAETQPPGPLAADALLVDGQFQTTVPGLYAAGDAAAQMPSVPNAIATGATAAAMLVRGLMVG